MTVCDPLPADGKIKITLPGDLPLDVTAAIVSTSAGENLIGQAQGGGGFAPAMNGNKDITLTRDGAGDATPSGTTLVFILKGVKNPQTPGNSGNLAVATLDSTGATVNEDLDVDGEQIKCASFISAPTVTLSDPTVNKATDATISFTPCNPVPADGVFSVKLPWSMSDANTAGVSVSTFKANGGTAFDTVGGSSSVSADGSTLTIARDGSGPVIASNTPIEITLAQLVSPAAAGVTDMFAIATASVSGTPLDEDDEVPGVDIAYDGAFAAAPTIELSNLKTSAAPTATLQFGASTPIPANGKIVLTVPIDNEFDASTVPMAVVSVDDGTGGGLLAPTVDSSVTPATITFTRDGSGQEIPTATKVTIVFDGFTNSPTPGGTGVFGVETEDASGASLDKDPAVPGVTISCNGEFAVAPAVFLADTGVSATTTATIAFTPCNPVPADGAISVVLPWTLQSSSVAGLALKSMVGVDGGITMTPANAKSGTIKKSSINSI